MGGRDNGEGGTETDAEVEKRAWGMEVWFCSRLLYWC